MLEHSGTWFNDVICTVVLICVVNVTHKSEITKNLTALLAGHPGTQLHCRTSLTNRCVAICLYFLLYLDFCCELQYNMS
jgi:hypothetical protein